MQYFEKIIDAKTGDETIRFYSQEEIDRVFQAVELGVRQQRNKLLSESDWTQVPDAPTDKVAWANYRQDLRNITSQEGFPFDVIWPIKPE